MTDRLVRKTLPFSQILLILVGILLLYLLVDFGRQVGVSRQRREELRQLEHELSIAQQRQAELKRTLEYAQSDAAVEEWARKNGLAKIGEVPVVLIAPPADASSQALRVFDGDTRPLSPREAWWDLFFGTR